MMLNMTIATSSTEPEDYIGDLDSELGSDAMLTVVWESSASISLILRSGVIVCNDGWRTLFIMSGALHMNQIRVPFTLVFFLLLMFGVGGEWLFPAHVKFCFEFRHCRQPISFF